MKNDSKNWQKMSGPIGFKMTNDFLFRALMQLHNEVLVGLSAALLGWDVSDIHSAEIRNPIELKENIDSKEFFLDVRVTLNNNFGLNLEMQVLNKGNWPERSVSYMCRSFDNLNSGEDYSLVTPVFQVGITDFSPVENNKNFFSVYKLIDEKDGYLYTDKIGIIIMNLTKIKQADDEDKKYKRDIWAKLFKSTTWEELIMLAKKDPIIEETVGYVYKLSRDEKMRLKIEAREEGERVERTERRMLEKYKADLADKEAKLTDQEVKLADQEVKLADQDAEIAKLREIIENMKSADQK